MAEPKAQIEISAVDKTKAAFDSINRSMRSMEDSANALNGVFSRFAPVLGAATFTAIVKDAIDAGDAMNDLAKRTGVAVDQLSGWKLAAESSGTSMEALAGAMNKAGRYMVEHNDQLLKMGINASTAEDVIIQLSGVLSKIPADDPRRAALAMQVLGKSAGELLPLLSEGSEGLQRFVDRGKELSAMTTEFAKASDEFNDKLSETGILLKNIGIGIAGVFLVPLNKALPIINETILGLEQLTAALWEEAKALTGNSTAQEANAKWRKYARQGSIESDVISEEQHQQNLLRIEKEAQDAGLKQIADFLEKKKKLKERANALEKLQAESLAEEEGRIRKASLEEDKKNAEERAKLADQQKKLDEVITDIKDSVAKRMLSAQDYEWLKLYQRFDEMAQLANGKKEYLLAIWEEYYAQLDALNAKYAQQAAPDAGIQTFDSTMNPTLAGFSNPTTETPLGVPYALESPTYGGSTILPSGNVSIGNVNLPNVTNPQQFIEQLKQMLRSDPNLLSNGLSRAF